MGNHHCLLKRMLTSLPQYTDKPTEAQKRENDIITHIINWWQCPHNNTINSADGLVIFHPYSVIIKSSMRARITDCFIKWFTGVSLTPITAPRTEWVLNMLFIHQKWVYDLYGTGQVIDRPETMHNLYPCAEGQRYQTLCPRSRHYAINIYELFGPLQDVCPPRYHQLSAVLCRNSNLSMAQAGIYGGNLRCSRARLGGCPVCSATYSTWPMARHQAAESKGCGNSCQE